MQSKSKTPEDFFTKARQAHKEIAELSLKQRADYMKALKNVVLDKQDLILDTIQEDTGKSRYDGFVSEIFSILDFIEFLQTSGPKILAPENIPTPLALFPRKSKVYYEPLGVILTIAPWNYPFFTGLVPCLSGFMAGNAVILKPSEFTPLTGLVEELLAAAGFDPNWIQVAYGDGKLGAELIDCKPDKIFFTGSTATGRKIMRQAADNLIPLGLELGGKDPMIVFKDANLERATSGALWGGFCNAGQTCTSVERCYVHAEIYDDFVELLKLKARQLSLGTDKDGSKDIGRVTTEPQKNIVKEQLEDALTKGAQQHTGQEWDKESSYIPPIVLTDVPLEAKALTDETFGPLLPIIKFTTEDDVIAQANDSEYGLSASIWGNDHAQLERVARRLVTGNISVNNVMITQGNPHLPFGGVKESGYGRTKGVAGLRAFTNVKSVLFDSNKDKIDLNWHPYTPKKLAMIKAVTRDLFSGSWLKLLSAGLKAFKLERYANKIGRQRS